MNEQPAHSLVEELRQRLYQTVCECDGDLSHPRIVAASEALDLAIMQYMRQRLRDQREFTSIPTTGIKASTRVAVGWSDFYWSSRQSEC